MNNNKIDNKKRLNKSLLGRMVAFGLSLVMIFSLLIFCVIPSSAAASPSKVINLVFDDSESMIYDFNTKTKQDKWCQAKYALEIFAAMLDKGDVLNIYYMSDYGRHAIGEKDNTLKWYVLDRVNDYSKTPETIAKPLTVRGSEEAEKRIQTIHEKVTVAGSTPFYAVEKAYYDLKHTNGFDQKWFVVLTDGAFIDRVDVKNKQEIETKKDEVKETFKKYNEDSDIKVEYFGIGNDSLDLSSIGSNFRRAVNSKDVPINMRKICQDVFNRPSIGSNYNESTKEINVEFPLSQIVIFTQGGDSTVESVSGINSSPSVCSVKYSDIATTSDRFPEIYKDFKPVKDLTGNVYIYEGSFTPGKYKISTKAQTVEVYYLLGVTPQVVFYNDDTEQTYKLNDDLVAGTYTIQCILADEKGDDYSSKIKSEVKYAIKIGDLTYTNGDKITIPEGKLQVNTKATFDITGQEPVTSSQSCKVKAAELVIKPEKKEVDFPYGKLGEADYKNNTPIVIQATRQGKPLSDSDWKKLVLTVATKSNKENIDFDWTLGEENSTYYIYPKWKNNDKKEAEYGKMKVLVQGELATENGDSLKSGNKVTMNVNATLLEKLAKNMFWVAPSVILLLLFILFKSMKAYPSIVRSKNGKNVGKNIRLAGDNLTITGSRTAFGQPQVSFSTKKLNRRWTPSAGRGIVLTGISGSSDVTSIQVKGKKYDLNPSGEWEPKFKETPIYSGARFNLSKPSADIDFNCKLHTKKK